MTSDLPPLTLAGKYSDTKTGSLLTPTYSMTHSVSVHVRDGEMIKHKNGFALYTGCI